MLKRSATTLRTLVLAKIPKFTLLLGAIACMLMPPALAQTANTGSISGTVTEQSGAVVPQAKVTATAETGLVRSTVSGPQGTYLLPLLPPGSYKVEASKSGFKVASYPKILVSITETKVLPVRLELGNVSETVTVNAQGELLQTESSTLGHVVTGNEIRSLPLVTGNYTQILGLSPGVSSEVFNASEIGRGGVDDSFVVNGGASSDNNFQMNGVEINDLQGSGHFSGGIGIPNPESIQEFKVQTSQYDASYGRDAGANVDVLTKGGTNKFHGSLFEFFRNEALNANEFFRNRNGQKRPILRQNQFGFAVGGPILKDKLLFFGSYQGTRQLNGVDPDCSSNVVLPPLTADRSAAGIGAAVGLPGFLVSPQALAIFNFKLPNGDFLVPNPQRLQDDPNNPGTLQGLSSFSLPCDYNENQFVSNLDYLQSEKSRFEGRFFFANSDQTKTLPGTHFTGDTLPGSPSNQPARFRNLSLAHTYIFTSHLVNQAQFGFHQVDSNITQESPFKFSDVGINAPAFVNDLPVVDVIGGFNIGGNGQATHIRQNTFVFQDNLSWVRGRHSFKFGGSLTRVQNNIVSFDFAGFTAFINYPLFTLGIIPLSVDIAGDLNRQFRIWDSSLYAQDDYKITPRLTLNLGFRFERLGDFSDARGHTSTLDPTKVDRDPGPGGSLAGFIVGSDFKGDVPSGVVKAGNDIAIKGNGQNTLNPRVGFAWRIPGTERLVMRGGYGIFHQRLSGQPYIQQITNQPFALVQQAIPNFAGDISNPFLADPGPFPQFIPYQSTLNPDLIQSVFTLDQDIRPPIFQRYSLNLQTQIFKDFVFEVGYAGARGQHLVRIRSLNQALSATPQNPIRGQTDNTLANLQLRAPFQGFATSSFQFAESKGASWYNSLQTSLNKRFSHGFQFLASYTFARYLADNTDATTGANGGNVTGDQNDFHSVYGPDSFLREHRFVLSGIYEFPGPRNRTSWVGQLLGGWRLSGVGTVQSGQRLTVTDLNPTNVFGSIGDFAQLVPGCKANLSTDLTKRLDKYFDTACFTASPIVGADGVGTGFGNSPVGLVRGPGQVNTDVSVLKTFPMRWREGTNLEFRADFFNLFNHPQFDTPDTEFTSTSFGQVTNTVVNPRVIQFALKFNF